MTENFRRRTDQGLRFFAWLFTWSSVAVLAVLLFHVVADGWAYLNLDFLSNYPSRFPSKAGLKSALVGTGMILALTALWAIPIGVATAIFLEEYVSQKNKFFWWVRVNIANLAGMPSIVYGLLGLAIFVRFFGLGRSLMAGSMTLALLILPVIVIAAQEAIRAVPSSLREAAHGMGVHKWRVVMEQVLPASLPGIMTGVILALSRAIGESAPLIMIGALSYVAFLPSSPMDSFTVLPVQIFNWASRPQEEFHYIAAAGIIVLLVVLFSMNFLAVFIRQKFQRYRL